MFPDRLGIGVIGVSDVSGFVYDKNGLKISSLMKDMRGKERLSDISDDSHSYDISEKNRIFEVEADIFIPAALTGVINDKTAPKLLQQGIKIIVESAIIPTTPSADQYLINNNVLTMPDFISNAGGVMGSFAEYQGRTDREASELIRYKIKENVKKSLLETIRKRENFPNAYHQLDVRKLATEMAEQVVYRAMLLRKGAINVAREAYARKEHNYI